MSSNIQVQRICQNCGREFTARTTVTKCCSDNCAQAAYKKRLRSEKIQKSNADTQAIKQRPVEDLKAKAFLSIDEFCSLTGVSRRTFYRMIDRKEIVTAKFGSRIIIRRADIDILFENAEPQPEVTVTPVTYDISECYNMKETQEKFGISEKALFDVINRNSIPKFRQGKFSYVPKVLIDKILL